MFIDQGQSIFLYQSDFDCAGLIKAAEDTKKWETAAVENMDGSVQVRSYFRNNSRIYLKELDPIWDKKLFYLFNQALSEYIPHLLFPYTKLQDEGYEVLKYGPGEFFKPHVDDGAEWQNHNRKISTILFLNDDFTGGELEFTKHGLKVKPKTGTVLVFPSSFAFPHQVLPPDGNRYTVVTWFN